MYFPRQKMYSKCRIEEPTYIVVMNILRSTYPLCKVLFAHKCWFLKDLDIETAVKSSVQKFTTQVYNPKLLYPYVFLPYKY